MSVPKFRKAHRVAEHATRTGSYFFSPGTMQFFKSRLHEALREQNGVYLMIVSNQFEDDDRFWRIVRVIPSEDGTEVDYLGLTEYSSYNDAVAALNEVEAFA